MRKLQEFLEQSSDHVSKALSHSRVVITCQDMDLRYTWVFNPGQEGYQDTVGKKLEDFADEKQVEAIMPLKQKVLKSGQPHQEVVNMVVHGKKRSFDMTVVPVYEGERMIGLTTISVDISDLLSAQEELHQAHARLLGILGDKMVVGKQGRFSRPTD